MNAAAIYSLNHRIEEQVVSSSQKSPTLQTISHPTTQFKFEFSKKKKNDLQNFTLAKGSWRRDLEGRPARRGRPASGARRAE
jgi:hypothetical protein